MYCDHNANLGFKDLLRKLQDQEDSKPPAARPVTIGQISQAAFFSSPPPAAAAHLKSLRRQATHVWRGIQARAFVPCNNMLGDRWRSAGFRLPLAPLQKLQHPF